MHRYVDGLRRAVGAAGDDGRADYERGIRPFLGNLDLYLSAQAVIADFHGRFPGASGVVLGNVDMNDAILDIAREPVRVVHFERGQGQSLPGIRYLDIDETLLARVVQVQRRRRYRKGRRFVGLGQMEGPRLAAVFNEDARFPGVSRVVFQHIEGDLVSADFQILDETCDGFLADFQVFRIKSFLQIDREGNGPALIVDRH